MRRAYSVGIVCRFSCLSQGIAEPNGHGITLCRLWPSAKWAREEPRRREHKMNTIVKVMFSFTGCLALIVLPSLFPNVNAKNAEGLGESVTMDALTTMYVGEEDPGGDDILVCASKCVATASTCSVDRIGPYSCAGNPNGQTCGYLACTGPVDENCVANVSSLCRWVVPYPQCCVSIREACSSGVCVSTGVGLMSGTFDDCW